MESGKKGTKKGKVTSQSTNQDIKKTHKVDIAEDLYTPGIPISVNRCMITVRAAPIEGESACSARERSMKMYWATQS